MNTEKFLFLTRKINGVNIVADFYTKIINTNKIQRYKTIIQTGAKSGQSLANHVENMIGVVCSIRELLKLSDKEFKVLLIATLIHDINKVSDYKDYIKYIDIISEKDSNGKYVNLIKECEALGVNDFWNEYEEYMEDIREIIGRHSAHLNNYSEHLFTDARRKLPRERLEVLVDLIRAADVLDLSKDIDEKEKKRQFLGHINKAALSVGVQFKLVKHKVSDDKGLITSYTQNFTAKYLKSKGLTAVAIYKEGTVYLADKYDKEILSSNDKDELLNLICKNIKSTVFKDFRVFIKNKQSGINVDEKCLEIASIEDIFYEIKTIASKSKLPDLEKKNKLIKITIEKFKDYYSSIKLDELNKEIIKLNDLANEEKDKKKTSKILKEIKSLKEERSIQIGAKKASELIKEDKILLSSNEDILRFSAFLLGFYNFINTYITKKKSDLSWSKFYEFFNLSKEEQEYLNLITSKDALFHRPYMIGELIYPTYKDNYDELIEKIITYINENLDIKKDSNKDMWWELKNYINKNLLFSFERYERNNFKDALNNYANKKFIKCSLCSNDFEANDWMAGDVPYKIKVQNFSNKIGAGTREPKRKVCSICQIEYLLHKTLYNSGSEVSRRYINLLPKGFRTENYIRSIQEAFNEFRHKEITALYLNTYATFKVRSDNNLNSITPLFTETKMNGVSVTEDTNIFSNYFIMPMVLPSKSTDTEIWVTSLLHALVFNQYFDGKVIINELPFALFDGDEIDEIYIGTVPVSYKNLFDIKWSKEKCEKTIKLFINIFALTETIFSKDKIENKNKNMLKLLAALDTGDLKFIYFIYKELKKDDKTMLSKIKLISSYVDGALEFRNEGDKRMSNIRDLALFAKENNIYGSLGGGLKDNAILKPITLILDNLKKMDNDEDTRALCKREIEKYFERINPTYFGKKKIDSVDTFVDMFMEKILKENCSSDLNKLDRSKKEILSVYSYYFRRVKEEE